MAFLEKLKNITTGRTEDERKQIAEANKRIRQRALEIELKEREAQTIRLTEAKIRARGDAKLKQMQTGGRFFGSVPGGAYQSQVPRIKSEFKKLKKKLKKKRVNYNPIMGNAPKRYDIITGRYR